MSDNLRVPPELDGAGAQMAGHAAAVEGYLNTLKGKLDPLKEYWQGPAQQYYQDLQAEWNAAAEGLLGPTGVCGDISSALNLAWNNYTDCEWANVKTWTSAGSH